MTFALIHAVVVSLVVVFGVNPRPQMVDYHLLVWLMVAVHAVALLATVVRVARLKSKYLVSGWSQAQVKTTKGQYRLVSVPVLRVGEAVLEVALFCVALFYLLAQHRQFRQNKSVQIHVGSWMVLLAWLKVQN